MADNAVAIVTPDAAKARALAILEQHRDAVSFVRPEDLDTQALYLPVVSYIMPAKSDFYDPIPGIGIMAKPPLVNLIMEKAGINILRTETSKRGEYVWVAHCYGEKRQPDGTMRSGDASYEFDADKRAELDAINQPGKYGNDVAKRRHLLETAKFGEQRAVTGAQFALIHKMAHVSRSFKTAEELARGMVVLRIDRNVDGMLGDPGMRDTAIRVALGAKEVVFGPGNGDTRTRDVTPAAPQIEAPAESAEDEDPFADLTAAASTEPQKMTPEQLARQGLEDWLKEDVIQKHGSAKELIQAVLDNPAATLAAMEDLGERCKALQEKALQRAAQQVAKKTGGPI